jgi:trigger factor
MMPGQEKMVMDFYQKNQSALASLRGTVYEDKIMNLIKEKAKSNKKELSKDEAEKILKQSQKQDHEDNDKNFKEEKKPLKKVDAKKSPIKKAKLKSPVKKSKKVSKK